MNTTNNREELDQASGFGKKNFIQIPFLKFTATKTGKAKVKNFTLLSFGEEMDVKELGEEVKIVFLSKGKFKLKGGEHSTGEVMPQDKNIALYKYTDGKSSIVDTGEWKELKERYNLSAIQIPYVLLDGEIVKFGILPSSLSNYWDYHNSFDVDERIYEYYTIIKAENKISKNKSGEFYKISFVRGEKLSKEEMGVVAKSIMEVKNLREVQKEQESLAEGEKKEGEEIKVEGIPF